MHTELLSGNYDDNNIPVNPYSLPISCPLFLSLFWGDMAILENGYRKTSFSSDFVVSKTEQKDWKTVERAASTLHRQMHTDWPSAID